VALPKEPIKTGLPVLDKLSRAYREGTEEEFLNRLDEFIAVTDRLPETSYVPVEYVSRVIDIYETWLAQTQDQE
jgi:hypothetical protein